MAVGTPRGRSNLGGTCYLIIKYRESPQRAVKTADVINMQFEMKTGADHVLGGGPMEKSNSRFLSMKCIRLCMQQMPHQHRAGDVSSGDRT